MCPMVNTDELCDAHEVAELIGVGHANSVHGYQRRYRDMPRPVLSLGRGRIQLWLRPEIVAWQATRAGRTWPPPEPARAGRALQRSGA